MDRENSLMPKTEEKKTPEKPKFKVTKVNNEGSDTDEVFAESESPYRTKTIYPKAGTYKVGDVVEEEG